MCVLVADCVHLQLYRDARGRWGGAGCKAALSLQHYLGCELGFTLDKHSNTLALVCRDLVAILAFETRERLIQWQVCIRDLHSTCFNIEYVLASDSGDHHCNY